MAASDATSAVSIARTSAYLQAKIADVHLRDLLPEDVPELCRRSACDGVAWTYNEPTMWHEFVYDASKICKAKGLFTVFVTNGFINEEPVRRLAEVIDAANIDVKGFRDEFYRKICKARLQPVLDTVELAHDLGIHVELTYLIIPGATIQGKRSPTSAVGRLGPMSGCRAFLPLPSRLSIERYPSHSHQDHGDGPRGSGRRGAWFRLPGQHRHERRGEHQVPEMRFLGDKTPRLPGRDSGAGPERQLREMWRTVEHGGIAERRRSFDPNGPRPAAEIAAQNL